MATFGVGPQGFTNLRQADWLSDLQASMTAQFGSTTALGSDTYLGQLCGIFSERFALLSEALQDTYNSQDPAAAEGVSVDYILALSGLERLRAKATTTNPVPDAQSDGIVLSGLVLYGTPGTTIPAGSIIQTASLPTVNFTLDADVTVQPAQNASQLLVFSQPPTSGTYTLGLVAPSKATLTTTPLPYTAAPADLQAALAELADTDQSLPFTDVVVSQLGAQAMRISFGATDPAQGQPSSAATPQPKITVVTQALLAGQTLVNLSVNQTVVGAAAQGVGSATCSATGPTQVAANQLTVIGSGLSGWTGVTNPLDCLTGRDVETDTEAMQRRITELTTRGRGTLSGLVTQVASVDNVTAAFAFENVTQAALQVLVFSATPSGPFQLVLGGQTTSPIAAVPTSQTIQAAINACPSLQAVRVTGSVRYGFVIDFNGAQGGQPQAAIGVINNQTGVQLTQYFGRPPKSFEMVVQGGDDASIAQAILGSAPAGIAAYGTPTLRTTGSTQAGSPVVALSSVTGLQVGQSLAGLGLQHGALVVSIADTNATLSLPALGSYTQTPMVAQNAVTVLDAQQNPHVVAYSRPTPVLVYISCSLLTDFWTVPGDPTSGQSAQAKFDPASLSTVQASLIAAAEDVPIGGTLLARGTDGLISSFRDVPGILDVTLSFGPDPDPTTSDNLALLSEQVLSVQQDNVLVSFT